MAELSRDSLPEIASKIAGKRIKDVALDDSGENPKLILTFVDNTVFLIEYDWIYDWKFIELPMMQFDNRGSAEVEQLG
jgi:hypothetical protein